MRQYPKPNDAGQSARESACLYCFFALSQQARRITLSLQFSFSPPAIPPAGAAGQGTLSRLSTAWFVSGPPDGRSRYRLRSHGFALVVQSAGAHLVYPRIFRFGMTRSYRHGTVRPRRQLIIPQSSSNNRQRLAIISRVPSFKDRRPTNPDPRCQTSGCAARRSYPASSSSSAGTRSPSSDHPWRAARCRRCSHRRGRSRRPASEWRWSPMP